jgi:hypothetical protein
MVMLSLLAFGMRVHMREREREREREHVMQKFKKGELLFSLQMKVFTVNKVYVRMWERILTKRGKGHNKNKKKNY